MARIKFDHRLRTILICSLIVVWPLVICILSAQSTWTRSQWWMKINLVRDLAHVGVFFVLAAVIWLGLKCGQGLSAWLTKLARHRTWIAFSFSFLYAVGDEIHQYFVPKRYANVMDVGIDTVGILLALVILVVWERRDRIRFVGQKIASFTLQYLKQTRFNQTSA